MMSKTHLLQRNWIRFSLLIALLTGLYVFLEDTTPVNASLNGRVGFSGNPATNSGATCTACHAVGAPLPTVLLQGPTTVTAGATNLYTLTINGGPAQTGGLNVSVSNNRGSLLPTGVDTQVLLNELTHSAPKPFSGNQAVFTFAWTAPTFNDTVTLYGAGNSSDGQQSLTGDGIGATSLTVQVTGGAGGPPAASPTPPPATLGLNRIVGGLTQPTDITHAGDSRLFVTEKVGRIQLIQNGALLPTPFLDITGRVAAGNGTVETGLLGLAFHPNYQSNGYFYLNYTVSSPLRTRIARFTVSAGDANVADPNSELVLLEFSQPANNHNGGQIHFGADGYLYIASGDGGGSGDPSNYGQNNSVLLGKILRIDVDGTTGAGPDCDTSGSTHYRIPPGNPFADGDGGACDEIWATGLRNPWRFSFDRLTGDLWIADVGQNRFEEINFAASGNNGGANYGWRCYEGATAYNTTGCQPAGSYVAPLHVYNRNQGDCSVTGGYVYRGSVYPNLNGHYFFSDFCNKTIRSISGAPDNTVITAWSANGGGSNPITFGQDQQGELYVGYFSGEIYQITGVGVPSTATPALTATPTPPPTATATPPPTNTPLPTATPTATATATNTATPTASPTTTPTPTATPTGAIVRVDRVEVAPDQPVSTAVAVELINMPANLQVGAVTVEVTYDAAKVTVTACGPAPENRFDSVVCNTNAAGVIRIAALSTAGVTGNAVLALLDLQSPGNAGLVVPLVVKVLTFVDPNANPLFVSGQDGAVLFRCRTGDVNCDTLVNPTDALFMVQHERSQRPASDTIPPPRGFLYLAACDVNGDQLCNGEDARTILQCEIGVANALCQEGE
ncbi:MAG: PQQ-dependent sugar dehydrogenase [Caldilineaceae bacterium]